MILVDSNIILDILTRDIKWYEWSARSLAEAAEKNELIINDIIYTEVSIGFKTIEELEEVIMPNFLIQALPKEALFLAGKAFVKYKKQGGNKNIALPDFFIGAHAAVKNISLLTRDTSRYKTYFGSVKLITP